MRDTAMKHIFKKLHIRSNHDPTRSNEAAAATSSSSSVASPSCASDHLEAFSSPYLSEEYDPVRPRIAAIDEVFGYRHLISVEILVPESLSVRVLSARLVAPSFTTHSFAMNQRMVVLKLIEVTHVAAGTYRVSLVGPSTVEIAPPGYYLLFVVHADIPSSAAWVRVQ